MRQRNTEHSKSSGSRHSIGAREGSARRRIRSAADETVRCPNGSRVWGGNARDRCCRFRNAQGGTSARESTPAHPLRVATPRPEESALRTNILADALLDAVPGCLSSHPSTIPART